jgi:hypothetical protein
VTEVIKEMLKPVWKSGKLTREVRLSLHLPNLQAQSAMCVERSSN